MAKNFSRSDQLCWRCVNTTKGCEWTDSFLPVPGWKAEKVVRADHHHKPTGEGWHVYECPKFRQNIPTTNLHRFKLDIDRFRREQGLSVSDFCFIAGISKANYSSYLKRTPRWDTLNRICEGFGVTPELLFYDTQSGRSLAMAGVRLLW